MEKADFDPIADAPRRAEIVVLSKRAVPIGQGQKLNKLKISGQMRMSRAPHSVMLGTMSIAISKTCSPKHVG